MSTFVICIFAFIIQGQVPVPRLSVDLDLPPEERFLPICNEYKSEIVAAQKYLMQSLPALGVKILELVAQFSRKDLAEPFKSEIESIAKCTGLDEDAFLATNLFYEFSAACTSIVAEDSNGRILHGRNLDFGFKPALAPLTAEIDFVRNGSLVFRSTGFLGLAQVLTAVKENVAGVTINEREPGHKVMQILGNVERVLKGVMPSSWAARVALEQSETFEDVAKRLSSEELASPIYYILSGPHDGKVITRNATHSEDVWDLHEDGVDGWFLLQTNDDHWGPPKDDRREMGNTHMKQIGQKAISNATMYDDVLHQAPNFRTSNRTIYTSLFHVDNIDSYWTRKYPE